jgi:hypothetical protein
MKTVPHTLSLVITAGPCQIRILGTRSTKGWDVSLSGNGSFQGHRKEKAAAIKLARDACEPGMAETFIVQPAHKK